MHLRIEARRGSIRDARHWTRARSRELGLPPSVVSVIELLTSELVANAVLHGSGQPISVRVSADRRQVTVSVTDTSTDLPVVRSTGPDVPGGHGMRL
ncbi:MAG: putative anti-sigma regulatory factor, serine/threonine protein kinase, partial [Actinotalea sp.]|nr:putative anti-sigma regulatory factor, serine/threonine protein kinase [Actinotalea sp.]